MSNLIRKGAVTISTVLLFVGQAGWAGDRAELVGFASLPADTFAEGPPSGGDRGDGTPINANGRMGPFAGQPVQGFSGVQFAPRKNRLDRLWFLSDNGFGGQSNSADYMLRIYKLKPSFRTMFKGDGSVDVRGFVQLRDPKRKISYDIVNHSTYDRLLTGADFDIESFVLSRRGDIWVGDEFGPFILHFDRRGRLLEAPIPTPDLDGDQLSDTRFVRAPQNPFLEPGEEPNLRGSRGYEGMAFSPDRKTLYPMLEGTVEGDPVGALRIYEFSVKKRRFTGFVGFYGLDEGGRAIGDFTPINDHEFLVVERDGGQGDAARFKKVFKIDFTRIDGDGFVEKVEVADLLNISDPSDLNGDGETLFTFPFVTIEDVLVLDEKRILVANDNNYPFSLGRGPDIDNNEIIVLELPEKLDLDRRLGLDRKRDRDEDDDDDDERDDDDDSDDDD